MFLQWVARRPDPSRKRCYAGVLLGAHIHTVALTKVSNCDKFVMVHYTCLVQGTNFCRCHLIRHTSLRWAPFLCIGTGICARFYVLFRFISQRRRRLQIHFATHPPGSFHRRRRVARRPDPSRKRCHAGVLLGAHIHTVALTTVSTLR